MISKTKCVIIGLLCISHIATSHSLSNEQLEKQHEHQCNQSKTSDDWAKDTISEILEHMKDLDQSANNLNARLEGLKTEMKPQIEECLHITLDNLNISTIGRVDENSKNSTQAANNSMETKTTHQNEKYSKNSAELMNNRILDDLETKYLKNFTDSMNNLNRKFEELKMKTKEPHDEIAQDIRSDRFSEAEQKLKQADNGTYTKAVREVYNNQIDNVVLLRRFWDSINDTEIKNKLYQALHDEIKIDNVIDENYLSKISWSIFGEELPNLVAHSLNYGISTLHLDRTKCFQCMVDISQQAIGNVWGNLTLEEIMQNARKKLKSPVEQIAFQTATFRELERRKELLHSDNLTTLALQMNLTTQDAGFQLLSSEIKSQFEAIKNKLPRSIQIFAFSSKLCIKSTRYNEYLYAGTHSNDIFYLGRNGRMRHVYTRMLGDEDKSPEFKWQAQESLPYGNQRTIYLGNDFYPEEYLSAIHEERDDIRRGVFTLENRGRLISDWNFEFDGDNVYIKNKAHKEYLFADLEIKKGEKERYVFTYLSKKKTSDSVWQLEDCS